MMTPTNEHRLTELERAFARLIAMPSDFTITESLQRIVFLQVATLIGLCAVACLLILMVAHGARAL